MTTLIELKNMNSADLKGFAGDIEDASEDALRSELIEALRTAKQRDEKLAEQGRTITALEQGTSALTDQITAKDEAIAKAANEIAKLGTVLSAEKENAAELTDQLANQTARAEKFRALAVRGTQAVTRSAQELNNFLAELQASEAE